MFILPSFVHFSSAASSLSAHSCFNRVAIGQGKVREILFFFKVREFCKLVREILNAKKVGEKLNLVREKSLKTQGILFLHEGGHPV